MIILETEALTRRFGALTAVDEMTISVESGEVFGLLGPNGAGKTTAIKMLTTLLPPTSGNARVAGFDVVHHAAEVRRVIGYVPQLVSADGALTGYENLLIFAKLYDIPRSERESRVHEALDFMGLSEARDKLVRNYSGGMIRRLEIAQSMLHRPRVLFLDEATVGLDPVARKGVWEHIERLRADFGTTIVLTTHYMDEADGLCSRVAIMHLGKLVTIGTPAQLKASLGERSATLDDVFLHYTGYELESGGSYREVSRTRRVAQRLG
jgi:ABC-2 type transport system ATP-binding protein